MKYDIEQLMNNTEEKKYIFFWGHQPSKDGAITKTCFSQWWLLPFHVDGIEYRSAEHWMMAKKAWLFGDKETAEKILQAASPAETKKLGREVKNYDDKLWLEHRYGIVKAGNYHKFSQNELLKDFLLATGERILVEASPVDPIWGIGMAADDADILNIEKWKGLNLLGFALMEVRDELKYLFKKEKKLIEDQLKDFTTLYRPLNQAELDLIEKSGWKEFPSRLPDQPIFYPVTNESYAVQIAVEWNVPAYGIGYVVEFDLNNTFLSKYKEENVGGEIHNEYWIPAEELEEMNKNIFGKIRLIKTFR